MKKSAVTLIPGPSNAPPDNFSNVSPRPCHPPPSGACSSLPCPSHYTCPLLTSFWNCFRILFYFSYILYSILLPFLNRLTSIHPPSSLSLPLLQSPQDPRNTFFRGLPASSHSLSHSISELEVAKLIFNYRSVVILLEISQFPSSYWIKRPPGYPSYLPIILVSPGHTLHV